MKYFKHILIISSFISVTTVNASSKIVYGIDNRIETYQASPAHQLLAKSTAGMINSIKVIDVGNYKLLPPSSLERSYQMCSDERFIDQPTAVSCSGFLVGPDLLVTAGHCIPNQEACDAKSWVFDYKLNERNKKASLMLPKENVYKCSKVIEARLEGYRDQARDYSLIKLDRVVTDREPLKYRVNGKVKDMGSVMVIGHPTGLPQKVSPGGTVYINSSPYSFVTNLDTFGGNSGSAVFNEESLQIEGILVRGAKDYIEDASCGTRVNRVAEDDALNPSYGESVSRITDIAYLQNRDAFLASVSKYDYIKFKTMLDSIISSEIDLSLMYDNDKNTALHLVAAKNNVHFAKQLIAEDIDLNAKNVFGETALHIAAKYNRSLMYNVLIQAGADTKIKNGTGLTANQIKNLFSVSIH